MILKKRNLGPRKRGRPPARVTTRHWRNVVRVAPRRISGTISKHKLTQEMHEVLSDRVKKIRFKHPITEIFAIVIYERWLQEFARIHELARDFRMSPQTVSNILKRIGALDRLAFWKPKILRSLKRTKNINITATRFNTTAETLKGYLKRWDVEVIGPAERVQLEIEQKKKKIIELYLKDFVSTTNIAKELGLAESTILNRMKRWGIKLRTERRIKPRVLLKLHQKGLSLREIARQFDTSVSYVQKLLKKEGVDTVRIHTDKRTVKWMRKLYQNGTSVRQIADEFDLSTIMVRSRLGDMKKLTPRKIPKFRLIGMLTQYGETRKPYRKIVDGLLIAPTLGKAPLVDIKKRTKEKSIPWTAMSKKYGVSISLLMKISRRLNRTDRIEPGLPPEKRKELVSKVRELRLKNFTHKQISEQLGITKGTIMNMVSRHNLPRATRHVSRPMNPLTENEEQELIKFFKSRPMSYKTAGEKFGLGYKEAYYILKTKNKISSQWGGVGSSYHPEVRAGQDKRILHLYKVEKLGLHTIGDTVGLDHTTVKDRLKKMGALRKKVGGRANAQFFPEDWERKMFRVFKAMFKGVKPLSGILRKAKTSKATVDKWAGRNFTEHSIIVGVFDKQAQAGEAKTFKKFNDARRYARPFLFHPNRYIVDLVLRKRKRGEF